MKAKHIQVITTISARPEAEKIAKALIDKKLAACVQIAGPIKSIYRWKGRIETAREWVCVIKAKSRLYKKIETAIKELHPYEVPEIIATPIMLANKDYLKWIKSNSV
jgi:periplasmic divalent cation tolerance protein